MSESQSDTESLRSRKCSSTARLCDNSLKDFSTYQVVLLFLTQIGYLPVAACLLTTSFFNPSREFCLSRLTENSTSKDGEFFSLLMEWGLECQHSSVTSVVGTGVMMGGLVGACIAGYLADRFGRRPVVLGTLLTISVGSIFLQMTGSTSWMFSSLILSVLGAASGGYMVVNLTLVVEFLSNARSRLLVVSVNGWSVSMCLVALLAYFSKTWRIYFALTSLSAFIIFAALYFWSEESVRWLLSKNRVRDARHIAEKVTRGSDANHFLFEAVSNCNQDCPESEAKLYSYIDLIRYPSVRTPLLALTYCFISSSVLSFAYYFNIQSIPGNSFAVLALMGLLKFCFGLIPFAFHFVGRRVIVLSSLTVSCAASYLIVLLYYLNISSSHWMYAVLSLSAAASIDPTWKINHLYSTELFPTSVRNMARGVCNMAARLGGVVAPSLVRLRFVDFVYPYLIFSLLLTFQFIISYFLLPETRNRQLPDRLPEEVEDDGEMSALEEVSVSSKHEKRSNSKMLDLTS